MTKSAKKLINGAKDSLKYLESVKKTEYAAKKESVEVEKVNLHSNYLRDVAKNPAAITEIGKKYIAENPNLSEKTLTKITTQAVAAHTRFVKSAGDVEAEAFGRMIDLSLKSSIISSTIGTAEDYQNAIDEMSKIGQTDLKAAARKWIEENKPGQTPKNPILNSNIKALHADLKMSLGLDLTRTQAGKLDKFKKYGMEDTLGYQSRPDKFPDPKTSMQEYIGGLTRGERLIRQEEIVQKYTEIYNKEGQVAADEWKDKALEGINKDNNTAKFLNSFLRKPLIKKR